MRKTKGEEILQHHLDAMVKELELLSPDEHKALVARIESYTEFNIWWLFYCFKQPLLKLLTSPNFIGAEGEAERDSGYGPKGRWGFGKSPKDYESCRKILVNPPLKLSRHSER